MSFSKITDRLDFDITLLDGRIYSIYVTGVYTDSWKDAEGIKEIEEGFEKAFWADGIEFTSDEYEDFEDQLKDGLSEAIAKFYQTNTVE